jgi:hypothetical protein
VKSGDEVTSRVLRDRLGRLDRRGRRESIAEDDRTAPALRLPWRFGEFIYPPVDELDSSPSEFGAEV